MVTFLRHGLCSPMDKGPLGVHQVKLVIEPTMELDGNAFQKVAPRASMRILSNLDQASAMEVVFDSMQIALSVKRDYCNDFDDCNDDE